MSDDPLIGSVLADRYRVDLLIGEGAMGRVYQAEHVLMRKKVALKVLHPELMVVPEIVQRFEREARAAAQIEHPHVAGATDFGKLEDGGIYLVLELIEGLPLTNLIESGPLPLGRVLRIARQVVSALEAAHDKGIVHRDLKPDNLLLVHADEGQDEDFIKVLDFGIAKVPVEPHESGKPITQVGMVYGTPEYMAPEQALGQTVDARADLYALGVVMFEMLTGRRPYLGPTAGLLGQQLSTPLPKMSQVAKVKVPAAVEQLVVGLLVPDPQKRTEEAKVVGKQLDALLSALEEGRLGDTRGSLLSVSLEDVTSRIEHVTGQLQEPVGRVVRSRFSRAAMLALLFGATGVVIAIVLVGVFVGEQEPPAQKQVELTQPPPPVLEIPEEEPDLEPKIEEAREQGVEALTKLAEEYPTEGLIHAELALALAKGKKYQEAVDAARVALALDPKLNENTKVAGALFRSAQSPKATGATFRLLRGAMGPAGVGIIYDLSRRDGISSWVKRQAENALNKDEVRQSAGPALVLLLELEETKECEEIQPLVERAALVGDKRVLPLLKELEATDGCGRNKQQDCYPCLREDDSLKAAISTIEQRVTLVDPEEEGAVTVEATP